ncbi:hypothetical protein BwiPL1_53770 (plasmid) [Bacillus wiedmannii]|nr:hypothetical protein BwiPL1_53770 [Bacillus wiedmannii]
MQEAKHNLPRAYFKKSPNFSRVIDVHESFILITHIMDKGINTSLNHKNEVFYL